MTVWCFLKAPPLRKNSRTCPSVRQSSTTCYYQQDWRIGLQIQNKSPILQQAPGVSHLRTVRKPQLKAPVALYSLDLLPCFSAVLQRSNPPPVFPTTFRCQMGRDAPLKNARTHTLSRSATMRYGPWDISPRVGDATKAAPVPGQGASLVTNVRLQVWEYVQAKTVLLGLKNTTSASISLLRSLQMLLVCISYGLKRAWRAVPCPGTQASRGNQTESLPEGRIKDM